MEGPIEQTAAHARTLLVYYADRRIRSKAADVPPNFGFSWALDGGLLAWAMLSRLADVAGEGVFVAEVGTGEAFNLADYGDNVLLGDKSVIWLDRKPGSTPRAWLARPANAGGVE